MTTRQLAETPTFGLWYDFRNRAEWRQPAGELYRRTAEPARGRHRDHPPRVALLSQGPEGGAGVSGVRVNESRQPASAIAIRH
jgi:hypothetical protein